jgi:hypothetical protein
VTNFILYSKPNINLLIDYTLKDVEKELESSIRREDAGTPSPALSESRFLIQGLEIEEDQ